MWQKKRKFKTKMKRFLDEQIDRYEDRLKKLKEAREWLKSWKPHHGLTMWRKQSTNVCFVHLQFLEVFHRHRAMIGAWISYLWWCGHSIWLQWSPGLLLVPRWVFVMPPPSIFNGNARTARTWRCLNKKTSNTKQNMVVIALSCTQMNSMDNWGFVDRIRISF